MASLGFERFEEYFTAMNGNLPFPWQNRLAKRVIGTISVSGSWPQVLALPTASGKTACLDIAIYALACQADLPIEMRTMPRRIFFVVDRRVIVDEAMERAEKISKKLADAGSGILMEVANKLRSLNLSADRPPLTCHRLRGGVRREDEWARDPLQPAIITSTVDQFGSRVLFRGYGVSASMRPIHAALAANDSLIILDEAHCTQPFSQTLEAIKRYRSWARDPIGTPFHFVMMSATPPHGFEDILKVEEEDTASPTLALRLQATKPTKLVEAKKAKGKDALRHLADELAMQALAVRGTEPRAIAIMVNRVPTAKYVYDLLKKKTKDEVVLVTGRMRPIDRGAVEGWLRKLDASISNTRALEKTVFVVSTQCLEVGANLDFDGMVSECASLDSLRQRFGRLNRMGRPIQAQGAIVVRADQMTEAKNPKDEDPIYGASLPKTWQFLNSIANDETVDMGFQALSASLTGMDDEVYAGLRAPALDAPIMFPSYLDCWVQTSPEPTPDPEVSVFLHGPNRSVADIDVCWRADLDPEKADEKSWIETVTLCPPSPPELLPVPPLTFRRWFKGIETPDKELTDVEGCIDRDEESEPTKKVWALVWRGPVESYLTDDLSEIAPGDIVVLPTSSGGWDYLGHVPDLPQDPSEMDRGDESTLISRSRLLVRLHPQLITTWPVSEAKTRILTLINDPNLVNRLGEPELEDELYGALLELTKVDSLPTRCRSAMELLVKNKRGRRIIPYPSGPGLVIRSDIPILIDKDGKVRMEPRSISSGTKNSVTLLAHSQNVERIAQAYVHKTLPSSLHDPVISAALTHDLGKADIRFQALMRGGDLRAASASIEPLAKSNWSAGTRDEYETARGRSGYPAGGRHELLSTRFAELIGLASEQDLTLHLISSHHGRCRPFAPLCWDEKPIEVSLEWNGRPLKCSSDAGLDSLASGVADRFWDGVRRFGWWGEAYLETMVRLADHRSSEHEAMDETIDDEGEE